MKSYLKWGILLVAISTLAYLIWEFTSTLSRKQATNDRIQTLPAFTSYGLDSSRIMNTSFTSRPLVCIYFDPDCEHCQREAEELRKKATLLNKNQVLMLSSAPLSALRTFARTYRLSSVPALQTAHVDRRTAYETFGFSSVPDVLIYRADGSLAKHFRGETSVEAIARHL